MIKLIFVSGYSGCLKSHFIQAQNGDFVIESPSKPLLNFQRAIGNDCDGLNNISSTIWAISQAVKNGKKKIVIERTPFDYLFFQKVNPLNKEFEVSDENVKTISDYFFDCIKQICGSDVEMEWVIIRQESQELFDNYVNKNCDPNRRMVFSDWADYQNKQEDFLEFVVRNISFSVSRPQVIFEVVNNSNYKQIGNFI